MEGHRTQTQRLCSAESPCNERPPPGAQDFVALVALAYKGGGKSDARDLVSSGIRAMGAHGASYDVWDDSCGEVWPKPSLKHATRTLYSGRSVRGTVCFQIAKNDARSLMLYTGDPIDAPEGAYLSDLPAGVKRVWFALR